MGTSGLGTLLVEDGLLTEADRRTIKRTCGGQGSAFARGVLALGLLDEDELAAFLAEKTRWKVAPKGLFKQSKEEVWGIIDRPLIERLEVLPLYAEGQVLHVAMVDPLDQDTLHQLAFFTGYKIAPVISTMSEIRAGLQKLMANYHPIKSQLEDFLENHASSASRRSRLVAASTVPKKKKPKKPAFSAEDSFSSGDSFEMGSGAPNRWTSPVPPPVAPGAPVSKTEARPPAAAPIAAAAAGAGVAATLAGGDDLDFHADDDLFKESSAATPAVDPDLGGLDDFEEAASTASASAAPAPAGETLDGLGDDIDNLGLEDAGDDLFGEEKAAAPAAAAPAKPKAKAPPLDFGADDGEDDVDLSAFDPDAEPALDDLDSDLSAISDDLAGKPAGKAAGDLGGDLDDELDGELGGELDAGLADEFSGDLDGDLGDTLGAASADKPDFGLGDELGGDLDGDLGDTLGVASADKLDFGLDDELGGDLDGDLGDTLGVTSADKPDVGLDEPGGDLDGDLGDTLGVTSADKPDVGLDELGGDLDGDLGDTLGVTSADKPEVGLGDKLGGDLDGALEDILGGDLDEELTPKAAPKAVATPKAAAPKAAPTPTPTAAVKSATPTPAPTKAVASPPAKAVVAKPAISDDLDALGDFGDLGDLDALADDPLASDAALSAAASSDLDELGDLGDLSDAANLSAASEDGLSADDLDGLSGLDAPPATAGAKKIAVAEQADDLDDLDSLADEILESKPRSNSALELSDDLAGLDGLSTAAASDHRSTGSDELASDDGDKFALGDDDFGPSAAPEKAPDLLSLDNDGPTLPEELEVAPDDLELPTLPSDDDPLGGGDVEAFAVEPLGSAPAGPRPAAAPKTAKKSPDMLAVDIDVSTSDPLLAPPTAADDAARKANATRNRELLRKLAGRKIKGA